MNKICRLLVAVLPVFVATTAFSAVPAIYDKERELFKQAYEAFSKNELEEYSRLRTALGNDYPIAHYLDYQELNKQFANENPKKSHVAQLNAFEKSSNDSSLTRKLTRQLQKRAASEKNWSLFDGISQSDYAASMDCEKLQSQASAGNLKQLNDAAIELWVQPKKHSKACGELLDKLEAAKTPPVKAIWQRIYSAMDESKPDYAKSVLHYLGGRDKKLVQSWISARDKPKSYLESGALKEDNPFNRRAMVDLVLLWSKDDTVSAARYWLANYGRYEFYNDRYYDTHRLLAMRTAYRRLPEAYEMLNSLEAREDDLELKEWRIRSALFEQDWVNLLRSLKRLPQEEQEEDHWAYWEARALEEAGHTEMAKEIYTELSELPTYHGFLAADKVSAEYAIKDIPIDADPAIISELEQDLSLIRAREYYQVDVPWQGRSEWNNLFQDANADKLAALAVLAEQWDIHDRAIFSAGRAEQLKALSTRFPVVYLDTVDEEAAKNDIPTAWAFGVMRRESAFIRDVKSSAGAVGLMQLMPNTAKYVAGLQGQKNWKGDLTDVETNIGFGTFYLRHVMDKFDDNQVLATASYNAGPRRVGIWLPPKEMDADVWIDAIPYSETRRYVRAVMAYTAIYEWHLTKSPARLSTKLTTVPAAIVEEES